MLNIDPFLLEPVVVNWCGQDFRQGKRSYPCYRERGHAGRHDSQIAQEDRTEFQEALTLAANRLIDQAMAAIK